jgi:hypothetical protein
MKKFIMMTVAGVWLIGSSVIAQTTNLYHTNRVFQSIILTNIPSITAFQVYTMAGKLTQVVGPTNIIINSNLTKAVEYEAFAWGYESANAAWTSAVAIYQSYFTNHAGVIYDNAGWVKGTRQAYGTWGAFFWYLQNHITFTSSATNVWVSSLNATSPILQVLVGSLGDYPPMTNVVAVGPTNWAAITNFIGAGVATDVLYRANLDTYYEILIPDLLVTPATNSLLMTNVFEAKSYPMRWTPTNYHFEIRRASSTNWYTLTNGTISAYTSVVAVAGTFKVRVTISVTNAKATSLEKDFVAQFPSYTEITANTAVVDRLNQAWSNTLAATTSTGRREEGFWIQVNTLTQRYEFAATDTGPTVGPTNGAYVIPRAKPADNPVTPTPFDRPTYTVAYFHTHTPTTYRPRGRSLVGPSRPPQFPNDEDSHFRGDAVGIVYDYVATVGSGIPASHPLNSAAQLYPSGPQRRNTPP